MTLDTTPDSIVGSTIYNLPNKLGEYGNLPNPMASKGFPTLGANLESSIDWCLKIDSID